MATQSDSRSPVSATPAALWASAFVIAAMIVTQAGRLGPVEPAFGGNLAEVGQIRLLTADAGGNEDYLAVLNIADETISIYSVLNQRSIELYQVARLPDLFEQARGGTGGRR